MSNCSFEQMLIFLVLELHERREADRQHWIEHCRNSPFVIMIPKTD